MNTLEKCAEILSDTDYAIKYSRNLTDTYWLLSVPEEGTPYIHNEKCNPFYSGKDLKKECVARMQADAIEDWLFSDCKLMIEDMGGKYSVRLVSEDIKLNSKMSLHQWRLDRIKWCIEELIK